MPIRDYNGTTGSEIARLYDDDGSVFSQIGKVYDNDGTAGRLIYSSDIIVIGDNRGYTSGWVTIGGAYAHAGTITDSGNAILQYTTQTSFTNYTGSGNARSAVPIDLTGYSTLYFTVSDFYYAAYGRVGLSQIVQSGTALGNNDHFSANSAVWKTNRFTPFTANGTYSINVSDLSGNHYIYLGLIAVYNSSNGTGHVYYSNMYLV